MAFNLPEYVLIDPSHRFEVVGTILQSGNCRIDAGASRIIIDSRLSPGRASYVLSQAIVSARCRIRPLVPILLLTT